jgi:hypothetical protein
VDMDNVQIEIVFRPIPQPSATPGRRPQGESRPAPRPWQQRTGRPPAAHDAGPPSPTQPSPPAAKPGAGSTAPTQAAPTPAKPEARAPGPPPKAAATAPQQGRVQAPPGAGPAAPVEPPSSSQQGTNRPTPPGAKT